MLITTTFFMGIDQIGLSATPKQGERFADLYYLTTNQERICEIVNPNAYGLGVVETSYLTNGRAKALIYRVSKQEVNQSDVGVSLGLLLNKDMEAVKNLMLYLWMIKDNAVRFDRAWIVATTSPNKSVFNNNTWETRHYCADGTDNTINFNVEELRTARLIPQTPLIHIRSRPFPTMLTNDSLRFQRFLLFVDAGRSDADLAIKIAQYCSGLESLVSTARTELTHQVSERIATVLEQPGEDRVNLYKQMKKAYEIRSKAVHGATFKPKDAGSIQECAKRVDQICRDLVKAYYDNKNDFRSAVDGSEEAMNNFFLNQILGNGKARETMPLVSD